MDPLPHFPPLSTSRELVSAFTNYMRFHFSVSQPKVQSSRARSFLLALPSHLPEKFNFSSCFSAEFITAVVDLFSFTAIGSDKVAYSMLKHLPHYGMHFFLLIFNLPWSCLSFHLKDIFVLFPSIRWESLLTFLLISGITLSPASQSFLNAPFYHV